MEVDEAHDVCDAILDTVGEAVVADRSFLEDVLFAFVTRGHVLLEDVPGTGKTLTARSIATALGLTHSRIQFTPDLLPADITGTNVFNDRDRTFEFSEGPVFANVVLADEINRAPPKTQAALMEAMEEAQVTVDGVTHTLPSPFFVIATQNPVEQEGTFPLPEAQLDRFTVKTRIGYPGSEGERELLDRRLGRTTQSPTVETVTDSTAVRELRDVPESVHVDSDLLDFIIDIVEGTRADSRVNLGVSPRGTQRLLEASRSRATMRGRSYVTPDDIVRVADPVLVHRLQLTPEAKVENVDPATIVEDVLTTLSIPALE